MRPCRRLNRATRRWYSWFAPLYDPLMGHLEGKDFNEWRKLLWSKIERRSILEIGVGTGRNFPFYPEIGVVTAIDNSAKMLELAKAKAARLNIRVQLELMDVQQLAFNDASFDTVVSSLVFCEVENPLQGLAEIKRVVRSGGKVVMLEHVISDQKWQSWVMNLVNPLAAGMIGENLNRDTVGNVRKSGLIVEKVTRLSSIFRLIEARKEMIFMLK